MTRKLTDTERAERALARSVGAAERILAAASAATTATATEPTAEPIMAPEPCELDTADTEPMTADTAPTVAPKRKPRTLAAPKRSALSSALHVRSDASIILPTVAPLTDAERAEASEARKRAALALYGSDRKVLTEIRTASRVHAARIPNAFVSADDLAADVLLDMIDTDSGRATLAMLAAGSTVGTRNVGMIAKRVCLDNCRALRLYVRSDRGAGDTGADTAEASARYADSDAASRVHGSGRGRTGAEARMVAAAVAPANRDYRTTLSGSDGPAATIDSDDMRGWLYGQTYGTGNASDGALAAHWQTGPSHAPRIGNASAAKISERTMPNAVRLIREPSLENMLTAMLRLSHVTAEAFTACVDATTLAPLALPRDRGEFWRTFRAEVTASALLWTGSARERIRAVAEALPNMTAADTAEALRRFTRDAATAEVIATEAERMYREASAKTTAKTRLNLLRTSARAARSVSDRAEAVRLLAIGADHARTFGIDTDATEAEPIKRPTFAPKQVSTAPNVRLSEPVRGYRKPRSEAEQADMIRTADRDAAHAAKLADAAETALTAWHAPMALPAASATEALRLRAVADRADDYAVNLVASADDTAEALPVIVLSDTADQTEHGRPLDIATLAMLAIVSAEHATTVRQRLTARRAVPNVSELDRASMLTYVGLAAEPNGKASRALALLLATSADRALDLVAARTDRADIRNASRHAAWSDRTLTDAMLTERRAMMAARGSRRPITSETLVYAPERGRYMTWRELSVPMVARSAVSAERLAAQAAALSVSCWPYAPTVARPERIASDSGYVLQTEPWLTVDGAPRSERSASADVLRTAPLSVWETLAAKCKRAEAERIGRAVSDARYRDDRVPNVPLPRRPIKRSTAP